MASRYLKGLGYVATKDGVSMPDKRASPWGSAPQSRPKGGREKSVCCDAKVLSKDDGDGTGIQSGNHGSLP